jgi:DsbC/DsbD-like thiol-disulfide interchange protein
MTLAFRPAVMKGIHKALGTIIAACGILTILAAPARAADASPWIEENHAAFRLIAGANKQDAATLRAGVEIKMEPGWKTYWRYPGDSGVPPRFDFSRSENLASAKVLYPAPHHYSDEAGNALGYKNGVVFPLRLTPKQPGKPVKLHVKLDYAICEKLCVPAQGSAELTLGAGASAQDAALSAAEARVPTPVTAEQAGLTVHRVNNAAKPLVMVDLKAPAGKPVELFVEGPTAEWALPIPKPAPGAAPGHRQFGFELDGLPPGVDPKGHFDLTFTVVEGTRAREIKSRLD